MGLLGKDDLFCIRLQNVTYRHCLGLDLTSCSGALWLLSHPLHVLCVILFMKRGSGIKLMQVSWYEGLYECPWQPDVSRFHNQGQSELSDSLYEFMTVTHTQPMPQFCSADKMKLTAERQDADLKIQHVSRCLTLQSGGGIRVTRSHAARLTIWGCRNVCPYPNKMERNGF